MNWQDVRWPINLDSPPTVRMMMVDYVYQRAVRQYLLRDHWAMHLYEYEGDLRMGDHWLPIRPGYVSITPEAMAVEYHWYGPSPLCSCHFAIPAAPSPEPGPSLPAMIDLGEDYAHFKRDFAEAARCRSTTPARAAARLWDLLWSLATRRAESQSPRPGMHPALQQAVERIDLSTGEPLRVADLAASVSLSHNQLTRLFQASFGTTVIGYMRRRRMERARYLLTATTMPIKAIAFEVGIPDLQQFNKMMRREFGRPPRALRDAERSTTAKESRSW